MFHLLGWFPSYRFNEILVSLKIKIRIRTKKPNLNRIEFDNDSVLFSLVFSVHLNLISNQTKNFNSCPILNRTGPMPTPTSIFEKLSFYL